MSDKGNSPRYIATGKDLLENYARTGSAADFEQIVRRFAPIVFGECRRVTRNPHDAEDAAQLTFLALAMELKVGKTINYPSAWLQRVAKHQAIKIVRSRGRRQKREDAVRKQDLELPNEIALDAAHNSGVIRDEIDHLPDRYRLPLVLHYFGSMSLESIAGELKIGKQTVGTRLHRARKMLATKLSGHGIQLDAPLLATTLSVVVPAAVVETIVRAATFPTPRAPFAFQATLTQMFHATALTAMRKWMRGAAVATLVLACGSAVGNLALPTWAKLPKFEGGKIIEWVHRWISTELKPSLAPRLPIRISSNTRSNLPAVSTLNAPVTSLAQSSPGATPACAANLLSSPIASHGVASVMPLPTETPAISAIDFTSCSGLFFRSSFQSPAMYATWEVSPFDPANPSIAEAMSASPVPEPALGTLWLAGAILIRRRRTDR